jgi:uncharacterized protein with von Willebrand factor type A (vWA) domain
MKERKKLEKDEQEAEEALEAAMARLARVRKMKRQLKQRGDELFARGMQSFEESVEVREESEAISDAQAQGAFDLIDWNSVYADVPFDEGIVGESSSGVAGH